MSRFNDNGTSDEVPVYQITESACVKCYGVYNDDVMDVHTLCPSCAPTKKQAKITDELIADALRWANHRVFNSKLKDWINVKSEIE